MAISYPLALPTATGIKSVVISPISIVGITRSIYTLEEQVQVHPGQAWQADINLPIMNDVNAQEWIAFLLSLNGIQGTFLMSDPTGPIPRGAASSNRNPSPLVEGTGQAGNELDIDNCPASITDYLKRGDYIQLDYGYHRLLEDASTDASGEATLSIWPNLRRSPANNESVRTINPVGVWRLTSSTSFYTDTDFLFKEMSFSCIEAVGFRTF